MEQQTTVTAADTLERVLTDIQNVLRTIPGLNHVGEDRGQLSVAGAVTAWPCALAGVNRVGYVSGNAGRQQVNALVTVTLAEDPAASDASAPGLVGLAGMVGRALHGLTGSDYSRLCRISLKKAVRTDAVHALVLTFRVAYTELGITQQFTPVSVPPKIEMM